MADARQAILDRIHAANRAGDAVTCRAEYQAIAREYQQSASMGRAEIVAKFAERLRDYDASVHEATLSIVCGKIGELLASDGRKPVVLTGDFSPQWIPEGVRWQAESEASTDALNKAEAAIAVCEVAIAHTGTLVVRGSRRVTLLPDRLLCVVLEEQIVETVPEAITRLHPVAADALTFISGPSATADIEMTRIRGVHGPRFLDVVLVRENQAGIQR